MKRQYYIFNNGMLQRKDNTLLFADAAGNKRPLPVENVEAIYAMGELNFNSKLFVFLAQQKIPVHIFNYYGYYSGSYYPKEYLNSGHLLVWQVRHYTSKAKRLTIAKKIVDAAAHNILANLKYYANRGRELQEPIDTIEHLRSAVEEQKDVPALMGIEGNIRQRYYEMFPEIIKQDIEFTERTRRPPNNMINALISFANSMVYTAALTEIFHTQLNPLISFLHEPGDRRYSLSLDLAEIFKPLFADRLIFTMLNKNQITKNDFVTELKCCYLRDKGRKTFVRGFDERLSKTIKHKKLKRNISYRRIVRLECYKLVKHILGEEEYEGFKTWW
ncbi:MAG TPA: type I-B CRISPR-associated endonuclease Cas1 [Desulfobacterales bacterium]|nr:type I-B CRISPR-associated endonuclease Cas1 [Desulfobacterales bacterium]